MFMQANDATDRIQLGESLRSISNSCYVACCEREGLDPEDEEFGQFAGEVGGFMRDLCRFLGDRHAGDPRIGAALLEWVEHTRDYEAWDALLTGFKFEGRKRYLARAKSMFPGPLTAHWGG